MISTLREALRGAFANESAVALLRRRHSQAYPALLSAVQDLARVDRVPEPLGLPSTENATTITAATIIESSHDRRSTNDPSCHSAPPSGPSPPPPPLPLIAHPQLRSQVFTHQGGLGSQDNFRVDLSYERLEFLGDAYIECFSSRLIYTRYPQMPVGKMSQLREFLVNNATLCQLATRYDFGSRIALPPSTRTTKAWADVFEAYVAALILQDSVAGFATAERWMWALWAPKLVEWERAMPARELQLYSQVSESLFGSYMPPSLCSLVSLMAPGFQRILEIDRIFQPFSVYL